MKGIDPTKLNKSLINRERGIREKSSSGSPMRRLVDEISSRPERGTKFTTQTEGYLEGTDVYKQNYFKQGNAEKFWNQTAQVGIGTLLGLAENVGYLAELPIMLFDPEERRNPDFTNALVEWAATEREDLRERFKVYRENPNAVWDIGDRGWWLNMGGDLVESILEFAGTGAGAGAALGKVGSLGARLTRLSSGMGRYTRSAAQLGKRFAQGSNAFSLSYTEGALIGSDVYQQVWAEAMKDGLTPDEAREKAAGYAAESVKYNTFVNAPLNLTSAAMFVRSPAYLKKAAMPNIRKGEQLADYAKRIEALKNKPAFIKSASSVLGESVQESLEELVNEASMNRALVRAGVKEGSSSFVGQLLESMGTEEGALSMVLGFVGGAGQKGLGMIMPEKARRDATEAGGRASSKTGWTIHANNEAQKEKEIFDFYKESLIADVNEIESDLEEIRKINSDEKMDPDKKAAAIHDLQEKIFKTSVISAFQRGTIPSLKGVYESLASMSPEEAVEKGFASNVEDTKFLKSAQNALATIQAASKEFNELEAYFDDDTANGLNYLRNLQSMYLDIVRAKQLNEDYREHYNKLKETATRMPDNLPYTKQFIDSVVDKSEVQHQINQLQQLKKNKPNKLEYFKYGINPDGDVNKEIDAKIANLEQEIANYEAAEKEIYSNVLSEINSQKKAKIKSLDFIKNIKDTGFFNLYNYKGEPVKIDFNEDGTFSLEAEQARLFEDKKPMSLDEASDLIAGKLSKIYSDALMQLAESQRDERSADLLESLRRNNEQYIKEMEAIYADKRRYSESERDQFLKKVGDIEAAKKKRAEEQKKKKEEEREKRKPTATGKGTTLDSEAESGNDIDSAISKAEEKKENEATSLDDGGSVIDPTQEGVDMVGSDEYKGDPRELAAEREEDERGESQESEPEGEFDPDKDPSAVDKDTIQKANPREVTPEGKTLPKIRAVESIRLANNEVLFVVDKEGEAEGTKTENPEYADIIHTAQMNPGQPLTMAPDMKVTTTVSYKYRGVIDGIDAFEREVDSEGKPVLVEVDPSNYTSDDFPIEVRHPKTNQLVGMVPTVQFMSLVNKKGEFVSIVGDLKGRDIQDKIEELEDFRERIWNEFQENDKRKFTVKIKEKTYGNFRLLPKGEIQPMNNIISDPRVNLVIKNGDASFTEFDNKGNSRRVNMEDIDPRLVEAFQGAPVNTIFSVIPTPFGTTTRSTMSYWPAFTATITENTANTIFDLIKYGLDNNLVAKAAKSKRDTNAGISDLIESYIYTNNQPFKKGDGSKMNSRRVFFDKERGLVFRSPSFEDIVVSLKEIQEDKPGARKKLASLLSNYLYSIKFPSKNGKVELWTIKDGKPNLVKMDYQDYLAGISYTALNPVENKAEKGNLKFFEQPSVAISMAPDNELELKQSAKQKAELEESTSPEQQDSGTEGTTKEQEKSQNIEQPEIKYQRIKNLKDKSRFDQAYQWVVEAAGSEENMPTETLLKYLVATANLNPDDVTKQLVASKRPSKDYAFMRGNKAKKDLPTIIEFAENLMADYISIEEFYGGDTKELADDIMSIISGASSKADLRSIAADDMLDAAFSFQTGSDFDSYMENMEEFENSLNETFGDPEPVAVDPNNDVKTETPEADPKFNEEFIRENHPDLAEVIDTYISDKSFLSITFDEVLEKMKQNGSFSDYVTSSDFNDQYSAVKKACD